MNYYIDTEFIEGTQDKKFLGITYGKTKPTIDLISIGIVAEDGREYYAISKDFNIDEAWNRFQLEIDNSVGVRIGVLPSNKKVYWIRENVLNLIHTELAHKYSSGDGRNMFLDIYPFTKKGFKRLIKKYGKSNKQIAKDIKDFCKGKTYIDYKTYKKITRPNPTFHAYFADYDWVVFCQLFGSMMDLPNGFPMYCVDLKQELDKSIEKVHIDDGQGNNLKKGRLEWIKTLPHYPKQENEHNALQDAIFNKKLHKFIKQL